MNEGGLGGQHGEEEVLAGLMVLSGCRDKENYAGKSHERRIHSLRGTFAADTTSDINCPLKSNGGGR